MKKINKYSYLVCAAMVLLILMVMVFVLHEDTIHHQERIDMYKEAVELFDSGDYHTALRCFWELEEYKPEIFDGPSVKQYIGECIERIGCETTQCPRCGFDLYGGLSNEEE